MQSAELILHSSSFILHLKRAAVMFNSSMAVFQAARPGATPGCRTSFLSCDRASGLQNRRSGRVIVRATGSHPAA